MRRSWAALAVPLCLSMLAMQLSGLHLHVNAEAAASATHGAHLHGTDADGHDHHGDKDVSVVELGAGASKLLLFLVGAAIVLLILSRTPGALPRPGIAAPANGRSPRWRPPLRAPPITFLLTS